MMRTTLTIEDDLLAELKRQAAESGKSYKQSLNDTLRAGLQRGARTTSRPYRLQVADMGPPRLGMNLDKARGVADALEDDALVDKLEQRK